MRKLSFIGLFCAALMVPSPGSAAGFLPDRYVSNHEGYVARKFDNLMRRYEAMDLLPVEAEMMCEAGDGLSCGRSRFFEKIDRARGMSGLEQLNKVDELFNRIPYIPDESQHPEDDYWATPEEFLEVNGGDCEEYAVAKYLALRELGWDDEEMRIVVLWDERMKIHHAVLMVDYDGQEWLLDNARPVMVESHHATHYNPLYAINQSDSWGFVADTDIYGVASGAP